MGLSVIYLVFFILTNYPPDLSPPYIVIEGPHPTAIIIPGPNEINVGNVGKLPPSLIPADVAPEPKIEVRFYLKPVRP